MMMYKEPSFGEGFDDLRELIRQFENMQEGRSHDFLDEDSFELIIDYFDDQDELLKALEAADMAVEQFPFCTLLQLKKADLLIEARKYEQALLVLEKAEAFDPGDIYLYILRTDACLGLGREEEAKAIMKDCVGRFSGNDRLELLLELADVYDDWEDFDQVFECLKMALEFDPHSEEALHKICFWAEFTGRLEESIRLHTRIVDEHPYNELAWFNLGSAYQELKLYEKSIDAYKYAIAIHDKFEYAYRNMADAYIRLRKYGEAIEALQRHQEIAKPDDVIYEAIGYCYEKQKKYDLARYHYRKAYHINPNDDRLYFRVGRTYMMEMQWAQAVKYISTAHKLNDKSNEYCLALGECYLQMESYKDALAQLLEAVHLRPSSSRSRLYFIRGLYLAGYHEEALIQLALAEHETGDKPVYHYYRCAILLTLGRSKEALLQLESALVAAPRQLKRLLELNPSVLQHSGVVDMLARYRRKK
jgi:tetratricopeptide (TPR) repeat protein